MADTVLDRTRFAALWRRLQLHGDPGPIFESLAQAYADSSRAYHNASHIADCLAQFDLEPALAVHPDEVEMALWFHDAIYDTHAPDNEAKSAAWAIETLKAAGATEEQCERVRSLILATQHTEVPDNLDAQVMVDIDLSILGRPPEAFEEFERRIRREYGWVPEADYRLARRSVLQNVLRRDPLYSTAAYRRRYENAARRNLEAVIAALGINRSI